MSNRSTFYNPYYFVWFVDRAAIQGHSELGDRPPRGLDRFDADQVRGVVTVRMSAATDLLVPDHSRATVRNEHKSLPVRLVNGKPHLAPTSVKGMIRSVFETVTLSRMGVFRPTEVTRRETYQDAKTNKFKSRKVPVDMQPPALAEADNVQPASVPSELSMADRVFGWVSDEGEGAYAGRVRFGRVTPIGDVAPKPNSYTLALSSPRPEYARFYTRRNNGQWGKGKREEIGYAAEGARLTGRKVYPHHREILEGARTAEASASTVTFDGVIPAGSEFEFEIRFEGLSRAEAGALLWSIDPGDPEFHHRFGGGKPYGFGSVKLSCQAVRIESGSDVAARYRSGISESGLTIEELIGAFRESFENATGTSLERHSTVRAILAAGRGFPDISYPRTLEQMANGRFDEAFKWFVSNENEKIADSRQALPKLVEGMAPLRALPGRPPRSSGQRGGGGGPRDGGRRQGGRKRGSGGRPRGRR